MSASDTRSSVHGFVADRPANPGIMRLGRARAALAWQHARHIPDAQDARLQVRDRRLALVLMVASSLLSVLALYGLWMVLRGVI